VVVVCESCSTRFRIDDARIPAKGRLVRCSQCKATFIAKPEDASYEETVQEVVAETTHPGAPPPEPAGDDLFAAGGEDLGGETATRESLPASDEERWEFDEEPRKSEAEAEPEPESKSETSLFESEVAPEPANTSLDEIGDPTEWDLLRGSVEPAAREAHFVETPEPPPSFEPERRVDPAAESQPFLRPIADESAAEPTGKKKKRKKAKKEKAPKAEKPKATAKPRSGPSRGAAVGRSLANAGRLVLTGVAWGALAGIGFTGAGPLLPAEGAHDATRAPAPRTVGLADGEARGVHTSFVENAFATPLFVIRGELSRPNADPRLGLRVHFLDAHGTRVGDSAWAGPSLAAAELRERAPDALRSELDAKAASAALGGPFVAVFESVPPEAQGFGLALEPLPAPLVPEVPEVMAEPAAPAEPTASSPPSLPPSSE
jgi:predicted Zn finger-like uncharacterized protein